MIEVGDYIHLLPNSRGPKGIVLKKIGIFKVVLYGDYHNKQSILRNKYYPVTKKAMLGI